MVSLDSRRPPAGIADEASQDSLIDEAQARALLGGIGRTLLRQLAHDGVIRSCKIARRRLYSRRSISKYISDRLRAEPDDWR